MSAAVSAPLFCGAVGLGPAAQRADSVGILAGFTGAWHGVGALGDPPGAQGYSRARARRCCEKKACGARAAHCRCLLLSRLVTVHVRFQTNVAPRVGDAARESESWCRGVCACDCGIRFSPHVEHLSLDYDLTCLDLTLDLSCRVWSHRNVSLAATRVGASVRNRRARFPRFPRRVRLGRASWLFVSQTV